MNIVLSTVASSWNKSTLASKGLQCQMTVKYGSPSREVDAVLSTVASSKNMSKRCRLIYLSLLFVQVHHLFKHGAMSYNVNWHLSMAFILDEWMLCYQRMCPLCMMRHILVSNNFYLSFLTGLPRVQTRGKRTATDYNVKGQ